MRKVFNKALAGVTSATLIAHLHWELISQAQLKQMEQQQ